MERYVSAVIILFMLNFCHHPTVSAEASCGSVGDGNADREATAARARWLYLDTEHPATCTGNITSWRVCYYQPTSSAQRQVYLATYAVYRRTLPSNDSGGSVRYTRVSPTFRAVRASNDLPITYSRDGKVGEGFTCFDDSVFNETDHPTTIHAGDVLGACVFDPEDHSNGFDRQQLDIIGQVSGQSLMQTSEAECARDYIPEDIQEDRLTVATSRMLHVRAHILEVNDATTMAQTTYVRDVSETADITGRITLSRSSEFTPSLSATTVSRTSAELRMTTRSTNGVRVTSVGYQSPTLAPSPTSTLVRSPVIASTVATWSLTTEPSTTHNNQRDSTSAIYTNQNTHSVILSTVEHLPTDGIFSSIITSTHPVQRSPTITHSVLRESESHTISLSSIKESLFIRTAGLGPTPTINVTSIGVLNINESDLTDGRQITNYVYNLSGFVNSLGIQQADSALTETLLSSIDRIFDVAQSSYEMSTNLPENLIAGSTLLRVLDDFALNHLSTSNIAKVTSNNTVILVQEVLVSNADEVITLIEEEAAGISIPREVFSSLKEKQRVRVASTLFRNMTGFLPESLKEETSNASLSDSDEQLISRLASPVISASVQCHNCSITNLTNPVEVIFTHLLYDKTLLENDPNGLIKCVFWKFDQNEGDKLLFSGSWSDYGCETTFNSTSTVCKCNHLTHFAILLSARPIQLPPQQTLALEVTGYIGVGVSLVAMAATIWVFIFLKPLRTMRNYIHIQLCISLGIAQVIFVAGIEPRLGEGGRVPVGCRLVAVLLHYWFLVSFMWMLMEGVVLYVALVRVFIKYHARYIMAFTIVSYGLPLLYVGGLTVPLGFIRSNEFRQNQTYDYGYEEACYLNAESSFIWSIIAPVILIFIANIGFFIMAVVIMNRHERRQNTKNRVQKIRHWLRVSMSLTVVMGITWIIGVLVIEVEALFPLAYIFTIFVAFQGLFIFIIFVLLSKQVRENYIKWWKTKVAESDFLSRHFGDRSLTFGSSLRSQSNTAKHRQSNRHSSNGTSAEKKFESSLVFENSYSEFKTRDLSISVSLDDKDQKKIPTYNATRTSCSSIHSSF